MDENHRLLRRVIAAMMVHVENAAARAEIQAEHGNFTQRKMYTATAKRAHNLIKLARRAAFTCPPFPDAYLVADGKGGQYELVGMAKGAGDLKGSTMVLYRDVATGQLYMRTPEDFNKRMVLAGGDAGLTNAEISALKAGAA